MSGQAETTPSSDPGLRPGRPAIMHADATPSVTNPLDTSTTASFNMIPDDRTDEWNVMSSTGAEVNDNGADS